MTFVSSVFVFQVLTVRAFCGLIWQNVVLAGAFVEGESEEIPA